MKKTVLIVLLAFSALLLTTAGSCEGSQGTCKPGSTRAAHGHTDVCNNDGKWTPMTHAPEPTPRWVDPRTKKA